MARAGSATLLCALIVLLPLSAADDGPDAALATALAVQKAHSLGRDAVAAGRFTEAVHLLEEQISRINGNGAYLATLREAYRGAVKELRLAGRHDEAQVYLRRLDILEPGARAQVEADAPAPAPPPPPVKTTPTPAELATNSGAAGPKVRGVRQEDPPGLKNDPFHPNSKLAASPAALVARGQQEFTRKDYVAARRLFDQAHRADPDSVAAARDQWAYCRLHAVTEALNAGVAPEAVEPLEAEVKSAIALAPRLKDPGQWLLEKLRERRAPAAAAVAVAVAHRERNADGWSVAETANFRILHKKDRSEAERIARAAEAARATVSRTWFGDDGGTWGGRCDIFVHASAADYSRATGKPTNWPGHSTLAQDGARVVSRQIDLHADDPNLLTATLPHETTHAVLAGRFGGADLPRWVDEGIALLSEPRDAVARHLAALPRHREENRLFPLAELMRLENYPEARRVAAFYAQSASLTRYLADLDGPKTFTSFVTEAMRYGADKALQRRYGFGLAELERRWQHSTLGGATAMTP